MHWHRGVLVLEIDIAKAVENSLEILASPDPDHSAAAVRH